ncbi:hypothetical protein B0H13DRAFT_2655863 [Mycena leptocephala]|nr:hypothetical protein B0H13DRAFT_2655863 [Mycena leptocephala]
MGFVQHMTLYTLVYNRCSSTPSQSHALHDHLVRFFAAYTCEIHDDAPHEALVEHYTTQWALFAAGVRLVESLFHYLDRRITAEHEGEMDTLTTVAFQNWKTNVLEPLAGRLRDELQDETAVTEALKAFIPDNFNGNGVDGERLPSATSPPPRAVMPAVSSGKVLVSGVVRMLLEEGFSCAHLRGTFASYGDKFELVVVSDITQDGAFDEAVKGVDAIDYMASPVHLNADNPDEIIVPTVKGMLSMLNSAMKYGTDVKRMVLTSSTAAVIQDAVEPRLFNELDWNEQAIQQVEEMGNAASGHTKYRAAKVRGEQAAWKLVEQHKHKLEWDLVVLNPPYVFEHTIHAVPSPEALNLSTRDFYKIFTQPSTPATLQAGNCWVDVRDLARTQVLALVTKSKSAEAF